jgi:AcrR family transcriptional regulator
MTIRTASAPPRHAPAKHAVKREALLDEAARQINDLGAGAVSLNAIATTVGLSRNALYYYVTDRADLAFRCYLRTCETTTEDLAIAYEEGANAAARIRTYVERMLTLDRAPRAILSDQDFLPEPQRATIADLNQRNVETLQNLITDGVSEGLFRPVHAEIAAQALLGMLNWTQLSSKWLGHRDGRAARKRAALTICDIFFNGLSTSQGKTFACPIDVGLLTARPFNAFDRAQATQEKMAQLMGAASRLFNRRGLDGASLDDISASVGATKGAVYHYFDDKTDLITRCYERAFDLYDLFMETALTGRGSGLERSLTILHLNCQAQAGPTPPLMLQPGLFSLPEIHRARFVAQSQRLWRGSQKMIRQGLADGSCRPCDAATVSEVTAGAFLWLPKWLPEDYALPATDVADQICSLFSAGIARGPLSEC